jgi:hypothetical protein
MKLRLKPYFLIMIFLLTLTSIGKSQDRKFIAGALIGFYGIELKGDVKDLYAPTNGHYSGTGGLSAGLNVKYDFSKNFYGALEIRYIRKGSIYEFISSYGTQAFESVKLNYFEIPLSIGLKIKLKRKQMFTETGLAYARMFSLKMDLSKWNVWDYSAKLNSFKRSDLSWVANIKYPVIKNERLLLGLRFSYSILSIHSVYQLRNMDYGVEIYYLINKK